MTTWVLPALGWALVALTVVDVVWTVLWSSMGAGPVTMLITRASRSAMRRVAHRRRTLLSVAGPLALVAIVTTWVALLLVGFTCVLELDPDAIRSSTTDEAAALGERAYFVGYTTFTLGNGGFAPTTGPAQALTVLMNAVGMFLITLSVTYLLPVISASVRSRSFGSSVLSLGQTPEAVLTGAWDGQRVNLDHQIRHFASELSALAHQHLAYPVLHLFHSSDASASAPLAVAVIDDAITLLDAVEADIAPPAPGRRQLRASIERYLDTYGPHVGAGDPPSPPPSLDAVAAAGVPLVDDHRDFAARLEKLGDHRSRTRSLLDAVGLGAPTADGHRR